MKMRWMLVAGVLGFSSGAWGWSAVTHAYIASCVTDGLNKSVIFGSGAADLNSMIEDNPDVAEALRQLTHHDFEALAPSAFTTGFFTHNEDWGADSYSHGEGTYARNLMEQFETELEIDSTQAHVLFEGCIDAQVRLAHGPEWGTRLAESARASGPDHEQLMVDAFAAPLAARVEGLTESMAEEYIRTAMQDLRAQTITLGELLARPAAEVEPIMLLYLVMYLGVDEDRARACYEYAMTATENSFQAELDSVCDKIREQMPNAVEGEDIFEGEGELQPGGLTITSCTIQPNPVDPGAFVSLTGLSGQYQGTENQDPVMVTIGFRNASGAWAGGEPVVVWNGAPGTTWQPWSGSADVIAPAAVGTYHIWVRNTVTGSPAFAVADFKNAVPASDDEVQNDKWNAALTVSPPYGLKLTACAINPNPVDPGATVGLSGLGGQYFGPGNSDIVKITAGFRDATGAWVGGEPVVVTSGVPGTQWKVWSGYARVSAPSVPGKYTVWVRSTGTGSDSAAIQDFKVAVPLIPDKKRDDRWGDALTVAAEAEGEGEAGEGEAGEGEGEAPGEGEGEVIEGEGEGEGTGPCGCGAPDSKSVKMLLGDWLLVGLALMALTASGICPGGRYSC